MGYVTFNFNGDFHITVTPDSAKRLKPSIERLAGILDNPIYDEGHQALAESIEDYKKPLTATLRPHIPLTVKLPSFAARKVK